MQNNNPHRKNAIQFMNFSSDSRDRNDVNIDDGIKNENTANIQNENTSSKTQAKIRLTFCF